MTAPWSSRSLGSQWQHRVFYTIIRLAGRKSAYALLFFVTAWYALRPSVRRRSRDFLRRRFPEAGFFSLFSHTWRLYRTFGQCLIDRAVAGITGEYHFDDSARERLVSLEAEGSGLILLAAHTGCWQMAPYGLARHVARPVSVLVHREVDDIDKLPHEHSGEAAPFSMIGADAGVSAPVALLKRLRQNELVCMMGDRVMGEHDPSVEVLFFGGKIRVPYLPYRLASASGATMIFVFALRTGPGQGRLHLGNIVRVPPDLGNNPAAYQPYAQKFVSSLEELAQRHPHQFFNFHNLWEQ